jgi:hypothetical protein
MMTSFGVIQHAEESKKFDAIGNRDTTRLGCGVGRGGDRRDWKGNVVPLPGECNRWETYFRQAIDNDQPNIAVVQYGPWEVADRRLEGSSTWTSVGNADYDHYLFDEMLHTVDVLTARGAVVTWLTSPYILEDAKTDPFLKGEAAKPARMDRFNQLVRDLPAQRPGRVAVIDLAAWIKQAGDTRDLRPDGVHFNATTAKSVAEQYLSTALTGAFTTIWPERVKHQNDSQPAAPTQGDKYVDKTYKVLVVGDQTADVVTEGIKTWADREKGLKVSTFTRPDCGLLRTTARQDRAGAKAPTPPECVAFRRDILERTKAEKPDFVLIVPSARDLLPVRLENAAGYATWGDAAFEKSANQHFLDMARQINDLQANVLWANVAVGDPGKGGPDSAAKVLAAADARAAAQYEEALGSVAMTLKNFRLQRLDLATWADKNFPAVKDGADLTPETRTQVGEWMASDAYVRYDCCDKLRASAR